MGKQTYTIKGGSIPAVVNVIVAGETVCQAVFVTSGQIEFDNYPLPDDVKKAVCEYFETLFSKGYQWLCENYDKTHKHQIVKSFTVRATKRIPGTLVNVRLKPDGAWWSGWYVVSVHKVPEPYPNGKPRHRICCAPLNPNRSRSAETVSFHPEQVEKTARTI